MSSETPPSIPPRKQTGSEKTGSTPAVAKPAAGATGSARPAAGGTARTSTATSSSSSSGTAATSTGRTGSGTSTATQQAPRPAAAPAQAPSTPAPAAASAPHPATDGTATPSPAAKTPAPASSPAAASTGGPRRVRLAISRLDPWSVMKLSFLISVAVGIMLVVATAVVWLTLDGLHVFASINDLVTEVLADSTIDLMQYVEFRRVISVATLIGVVDVFLITALSTIGAFLYNVTAALVGGVHVTMTDE